MLSVQADTTLRLEGIEFIEVGAETGMRRQRFERPQPTTTRVEIPRLFGYEMMSRNHAYLNFDDKYVWLSDRGSTHGTYKSSSTGSKSLQAGMRYLLRDDDLVVFGSNKDPGESTKGILSVKVKFVYGATPRNDEKSTFVETDVQIPWRTGFQVGAGIDALTGGIRASALKSLGKLGHPGKTPECDYKVRIFSSQDLQLTQRGFGAAAGIALAWPQIDLGAQFEHKSEQSTSETDFIICCEATGLHQAEILVSPVLDSTVCNQVGDPVDGFRQKYGDYCIAGLQRGYGCLVMISCQIKNSNKDRLTGAKFQAKGSFSPVEVGTWFNKLDANSKEFDLLNAKHHSYGYNDELNDLNDVLGKSSSVMDVFQNVSNTLGRVPQGVERSAILYHWSLYRVSLSTTIVGKSTVNELSEMHTLYTNLREDLSHPAFGAVHSDSLEHEFISKMKAYQLASPVDRTSMLKQLKAAECYANESKRQYMIIQHLSVEGRRLRDPERSGLRWKWRCGSMSLDDNSTASSLPSQDTIIGATPVSIKVGGRLALTAHECDWWTPKIEGKTRLLGQRRVYMYFEHEYPSWTRMETAEQGEYIAAAGAQAAVHDNEFHNKSITLAEKIMVAGWTLSCQWNGKKDPKITVESDNHGILGDDLKIRLDHSASTRWHCRVTFIRQSSYPNIDFRSIRTRLN